MRIVKMGKLPKSLVFFCDNCGTVFEADSDEYDNTTYMMACPICGRKVRGTTSEYDDCEPEPEKYLTSANFVFPEDAMKVESDCVFVSDEEIICIIKEGIDYLRDHDEENHWWWSQGDVWIDIIAVDDERIYQVMVARGYYDMPLNYDDRDDEVRDL